MWLYSPGKSHKWGSYQIMYVFHFNFHYLFLNDLVIYLKLKLAYYNEQNYCQVKLSIDYYGEISDE